jgi:hypothetical protein
MARHESFTRRSITTAVRLLILAVVILKLKARLLEPRGQNPEVP